MKIEIGKKIAQLRNEKNISQQTLADEIGVTNQAVSKWESESCYPDIELLPDIASYFGISIDELFGNTFSESELKDAEKNTFYGDESNADEHQFERSTHCYQNLNMSQLQYCRERCVSGTTRHCY